MNVSSTSFQVPDQMSMEKKQVKVVPHQVVAWEDFRDQVKTQVQAQQDKNMTSLIKKAENETTASPTKQAQLEAETAQAKSETEPVSEPTEQQTTQGKVIDKVV